jgi:phosphopantetheinyl transferase (holo-ACP synthase)
MNNQLDNMLCQKYPKIFAERHASKEASSMAWGIMCGDGWFDLLDALCSSLQFQTDRCGAPQVVASQIKEKFGVLSFHRGDASEAQRGMIAMAEAMSTRICEKCGKPGQMLVFDSLRQTLCTEHAPDCARPLGAD